MPADRNPGERRVAPALDPPYVLRVRPAWSLRRRRACRPSSPSPAAISASDDDSGTAGIATSTPPTDSADVSMKSPTSATPNEIVCVPALAKVVLKPAQPVCDA